MLEVLGVFFSMLGGALTTIGIIHILKDINDKWMLKQMFPTYLIVLFSGIGSIVIGYILP